MKLNLQCKSLSSCGLWIKPPTFWSCAMPHSAMHAESHCEGAEMQIWDTDIVLILHENSCTSMLLVLQCTWMLFRMCILYVQSETSLSVCTACSKYAGVKWNLLQNWNKKYHVCKAHFRDLFSLLRHLSFFWYFYYRHCRNYSRLIYK